MRVEAVVTGTPRQLAPEKEAALLRITQEALNNVKKHSNANQVNVTLSYMSHLVALDIVDNGVGFQEINSSGFGLRSMRERAAEFNGSLTIESEFGKGTAVAVSLPTEKS